ncbi:MAG TPA: hypothetical protein VG897_19265 [Terriglobales bacterium]|nr:hypothetical protein [Terriglobales bacterium]
MAKASKSAVKKAAKVRPRKAGAARKRAAPKRMNRQNTGEPGNEAVSIRMYRGLLGDFFLLQHCRGEERFRMLIDCGVLQCIGSASSKPSTYKGKDRIKAGVTDLMKETGGVIDLIVATHEHYDHLSGFILAKEAFEGFQVKKVWMAWTEDKSDSVARKYRKKKDSALTALAALSQNPALSGTEEMQTVTNLLQFYGGADAIRSDELGVAKKTTAGKSLSGNASCASILDWLKAKAGPGNTHFLKPGQAVPWGIKDAFRAYVLGPPRDDDRLRKLDPSKGVQKEVYLVRRAEAETVKGLAALHCGTNYSEGRIDMMPFARPHWRRYSTVRGTIQLHSRQKGHDPIVSLYGRTAGNDRIDGDWLGSTESLALKIDGDVNNTSLALALQVTEGRILLFPADAQVGNWESWADQTYPESDDRGSKQLSIDKLLERTIFYKVGHHASHNATLRERGLELMTDTRLCAMIPVVEKTAHEQKTKSSPKGWAMPYADLYTRLGERTDGRIVRGDGDPAEERKAFKGSDFEIGYGAEFASGDPLWVELSISL